MASNLNCMIFTEPVFDVKDIWNRGCFSIMPDSFSELHGVKYIILISSSFIGAFRVDHFEIPAGADSNRVSVHFNSYIKPIDNATIDQLLVSGTNLTDLGFKVHKKAEFVGAIPSKGFQIREFEKLGTVTDIQSMKANLKKIYGTDVEITITFKS